MSDGHGGRRTPAKPAAVSGPGAHSRRTDGNFQSASALPDQAYGAATQQMNEQRIAPMAGKEQLPTPTPVTQPTQSADQQTPAYAGGAFNAPSARPNEPISAGAPFGEGPGPEALSVTPQAAMPTGAMTRLLQQMSATDTTGLIGQLYAMAKQRGV